MNAAERQSVDTLKGYIGRLGEGEALESVQADFREKFGSASADEIVRAEQEMIDGGMPVTEVQKLCDLHSALFHEAGGGTQEDAAGEPEPSHMGAAPMTCAAIHSITDKMRSAENASVPGHPLNVLTRENVELKKRIGRVQELLRERADGQPLRLALEDLVPAGLHYDKKDQLILPVLKRHGVRGPSDVMWSVDGEIRKTTKDLLEELEQAEAGEDQDALRRIADEIARLVSRMDEMIFKEDKILFPLAEQHFTGEEWQEIYRDIPRFGYAWIEEVPEWAGAEELPEKKASVSLSGGEAEDARVNLPGGTLTLPQLEGILRALPVELTFVDAGDINRYFSEDSTLFPRPTSDLGSPVFDCHPPKALPVVKNVIEQLRSGEKDVITFVTPKKGRKALIRYLAVRSAEGEYLGVLETVEDVTDLAV